jgi:uncharacterized linocin/CFP29 family protein
MDAIVNGQGTGNVANQMIANGMDKHAFRPFVVVNTKTGALQAYRNVMQSNGKLKAMPIQANATLRRDEWKALDEAVLRVSRERLIGINDLRSRGLVYNIGNGMGRTVLESHSVDDGGSASMSMDGLTRGQNDRPTYSTTYLPLPIIHSDYEINARVLAASRNMGSPLDTEQAERAARKVSEKLEDLLFTDTSYSFGGGTIYTYLSFPSRQTQTLSTAWDASGKTAEGILEEVLQMKQKMLDKNKYGPYVLYIPSNWETIIDEDYNATSGKTVRQRLLEIANLDAVTVADHLPDDNAVMVQMTSDTVRLVDGMAMTNLEWRSQGGMVTNYKVMSIQVPQIRADEDSQCGIVHLSA